MTTNLMPAEVNISDFEQEVLRSSQPVLVEFWAGWSSSSRTLAPVLQSLAVEQQGALKVVRVDVDRNEAVAGRYFVRAVPTLLIFQHGTVQDQVVGLTTELALRETLESYL